MNIKKIIVQTMWDSLCQDVLNKLKGGKDE